jgi:hypothetical protein
MRKSEKSANPPCANVVSVPARLPLPLSFVSETFMDEYGPLWIRFPAESQISTTGCESHGIPASHLPIAEKNFTESGIPSGV